MNIKELSGSAKIALENRAAAIVGLSIRNGYFRNADNLAALMKFSVGNFSKVYLMLPDVPAVSTLMSFGYSEKEAKQKANLACNNLQNKCVRILEDLVPTERYQVIRWANIQESVHYKTNLEQLTKLFSIDLNFQRAIKSATMQVLVNNGTELPLEVALDYGVQFILQELAFITNAPLILNERNTAYIYHLEMPVLRDLLEMRYDIVISSTAGYMITEIKDSLAHRSAI